MKGKLLIVDDDTNIAVLLVDRFRSAGYEAFAASDGDHALAVFKKERPDLVLLDLHMPKMDGLAVLREIRELDANAAVIILTGDVQAARAKLLIREGACDFIKKPVDFDYLDNSIEANLLIRRRRVA